MTEIRYGYKVTSELGRSSYSISKLYYNGAWQYACRYSAMDWVYAEHGPMMLFDWIADANAFASRSPHTGVYKAAYVPIEPRVSTLLPVWLETYTPDDIYRYWTNHANAPRVKQKYNVPSGTVFAAAVQIMLYGKTELAELDQRKLRNVMAQFAFKSKKEFSDV